MELSRAAQTPLTRPMPASASPVAVVGGRSVLGTSHDIADKAESTLRVDTFRTTSNTNVDAIVGAAKRGVDVHALLDSDNAADDSTFHDALQGSATLTKYGNDPFKQHGKAISRDASDAMIATDVSDEKSLHRLEMGVRFGGSAATAFDGVQQLSEDATRAQAQKAYDAARSMGIVVNDPHRDRRDVSDTLKHLVDDSSGSLLVVSKLFDSGGLADRIAKAAERGVATTLVTHDIDKKDRTSLADAGVDVRVVDYDSALAQDAALHGTVVASGGQALLTTMPLAKRAIKGSNGRQSRELGVLVDGAPARTIVDAIRTKLLHS